MESDRAAAAADPPPPPPLGRSRSVRGEGAASPGDLSKILAASPVAPVCRKRAGGRQQYHLRARWTWRIRGRRVRRARDGRRLPRRRRHVAGRKPSRRQSSGRRRCPTIRAARAGSILPTSLPRLRDARGPRARRGRVRRRDAAFFDRVLRLRRRRSRLGGTREACASRTERAPAHHPGVGRRASEVGLARGARAADQPDRARRRQSSSAVARRRRRQTEEEALDFARTCCPRCARGSRRATPTAARDEVLERVSRVII